MEFNRLLEIAADREACEFCPDCGNDKICVKSDKVKGVKVGELREYHAAVKAALRRTAEDDKARGGGEGG